MQKTRQEIDELKRQWLRDPIWDIETTETFEDHKEELKVFRLKQEEIWDEYRKNQMRAENDRLAQMAEALGIPGNIALVVYIRKLEGQVIELTERLNRMDGDF